MAEELGDLVDSLVGLQLADAVGELSGSHYMEKALFKAVQTLLKTAAATATCSQGLPLREEHDIERLNSLRRTASALASTANTLACITAAVKDDADRYAVSYITSLAAPETLVHKALLHFDDELRSIARSVLESSSDDSSVLREILELCYNQVIQPAGTLNLENYLVPLREFREATLGWPYDEDFESEEYYEHEERLGDDAYAEAFRLRCERESRLNCERRSERERKQEEDWIGFWVRALNRCPNGSTLFYPPASCHPECHLDDVPRYLFRAFDQDSSGRSDDTVVASTACISANSSGRSRVDLLSMPDEEAAGMLYRHLKWIYSVGDSASDNLMSWSSSLLYVVQYAIWRYHKKGRAQEEVTICAVDTRKFPRGQFARDMSLLRVYRQTSNLNEEQRKFFKFRLGTADYNNGEYLSQGEVHHAGRSCVFSLGQLVSAGLHNLYPEFAKPEAMQFWAKRALDLRSKWSVSITQPVPT